MKIDFLNNKIVEWAKCQNRLLTVMLFAGVLLSVFSCKKFVEVDAPKTQLVSSSVFSSDVTAVSSVVNIYGLMERNMPFSVALNTGLAADELVDYTGTTTPSEFFNNSLSKTNVTVTNTFWNMPYQYIYSANAIIEGLAHSSGVSASMKQQLTGEAKLIRAFWHFFLVDCFGDVPLIMTTDLKANSNAVRSSSVQVFQQIVSDLRDAQSLLSDNYIDGYNNLTDERIRPNKWVATALLARAYLYTNRFDSAETFATEIINNTSKYDTVPLNDVFLKNSKESIWQLQPTDPTRNTVEGNQFILTTIPSTWALSSSLINSFENGDGRKNAWVGNITVSGIPYYYPLKYKVQGNTSGTSYSEYSMVLRIAEQYLIRAEARARIGSNLSGATKDLDIVRRRAGLPLIANTNPGISQSGLIDKILHERQVELFTEWGHRWFDLKRTGKADAVLGTLKPTYWQNTDTLFPIPQAEIAKNPNLKQNPGY